MFRGHAEGSFNKEEGRERDATHIFPQILFLCCDEHQAIYNVPSNSDKRCETSPRTCP